MQITSIQQAKKDRLRVNVYVDGQFWAALEQSTVAKHLLYQGRELTPDTIPAILFEDAVVYVTRKLFDWSQRRPRSQKEIKDKLAEKFTKMTLKNYTASDNVLDRRKLLDAVLEKLNEFSGGDEQFARWFASERNRQGRSGSRKIISELMAKGITAKLAQQVVHELGGNEAGQQEKLLQKKYGVSSVKEIKDQALRAKAHRYLLSKGYTKIV